MHTVNKNKAFLVFSYDTERIKRVLIFFLFLSCHPLFLVFEILVDKLTVNNYVNFIHCQHQSLWVRIEGNGDLS